MVHFYEHSYCVETWQAVPSKINESQPIKHANLLYIFVDSIQWNKVDRRHVIFFYTKRYFKKNTSLLISGVLCKMVNEIEDPSETFHVNKVIVK